MSTFGRGTLAAALATAMAVVPSLAPAQDIAAKPAKDPKITQPESKPDVITLADDYSENHPVIAIAILKGQKDQITGERIGDRLSEALMKIHSIPSKYFVEPGGDYTAVVFAVKGNLYGPYGLKESLGAMALAGSAYDEFFRFPRKGASNNPPANVAAKPSPGQ